MQPSQRMIDKKNGLLDADTPETVRMSVGEATALGMRALRRIGYDDEDAKIIVGQLIDNALCGYGYAGLPRVLPPGGARPALGLLAGAALARGAVQDFGFLFRVIEPDVMLPGGNFTEQMSELVRKIKSTPCQPGVSEIRIPSERAARERERRRVEGIVLE